MRTLGNFAAVVVDMDSASVRAVVAVFTVIANIHCQRIRDHAPVAELISKAFRHLPDNDPGFFVFIGTGENLSLAQAVGGWPVVFDFPDAAWFDTPGMIDQDFSINAKLLIEPVLVIKACPGKFPHCGDSKPGQVPCCAGASLPEISERLVIPKQVAKRFFVQFCNADTIGIRLCVFGHDVHRQLAQIQVGANAAVAVMPVSYSTSRIIVFARSWALIW